MLALSGGGFVWVQGEGSGEEEEGRVDSGAFGPV
jgi:hypothetical protein